MSSRALSTKRALLSSGFILSLWACEAREIREPAPTPPKNEVWLSREALREAGIETALVQTQVIEQPVRASGRVTFVDERVSHVFSPVTGQVHRILARVGQRVKQGEALATIESPDVGQFSSDLNKARADRIASEREFKRKRDLFLGHAASKSDFEAAERDFRKAHAEQDRAEAKVRGLNVDPNKVSQSFVLRAPIAGEIVRRNVNPGVEVQGQYESAVSPTELFTVGSLEDVLVQAEVFEMDLGRVHVHDSVEVRDVAYPGETFFGEVIWVPDVIDPVSRTASIRCHLKNPSGKLKPEMFVTALIGASRSAAAIAVSRRGLYRAGGKKIVIKIGGTTGDGRLRMLAAPVVADESVDGAFIPVTEGLSAGEEVVSRGGIILTDLLMGTGDGD